MRRIRIASLAFGVFAAVGGLASGSAWAQTAPLAAVIGGVPVALQPGNAISFDASDFSFATLAGGITCSSTELQGSVVSNGHEANGGLPPGGSSAAAPVGSLRADDRLPVNLPNAAFYEITSGPGSGQNLPPDPCESTTALGPATITLPSRFRWGGVLLNPQPLPPGIVELNPQPLPPGRGFSLLVDLNPQPLPPGIELNPQPLPPGITFTAKFATAQCEYAALGVASEFNVDKGPITLTMANQMFGRVRGSSPACPTSGRLSADWKLTGTPTGYEGSFPIGWEPEEEPLPCDCVG